MKVEEHLGLTAKSMEERPYAQDWQISGVWQAFFPESEEIAWCVPL
jgi:hypothetical protein